MKIIFLDIDGVMNCAEFMYRFEDKEKSRKENAQAGFGFGSVFTPESIETLNCILDKTNANIVISSSWRVGMQINELQRLLDVNNIRGKIIGKTPYRLFTRGFEIQEWLDSNKHLNIESFVILDDDRDMEYLMPYLVKTTWNNGLKREHIEQVCDILN